jgi:AraC-like DNA-binding protein
MKPTLYHPPVALARCVECFWTLEAAEEDVGSTLQTFANGVSGIIFQHRDGRSGLGPCAAAQHPFSNHDVPTSFVYGKRTHPSQTFAKAPFALTGVVFKPQALRAVLNVEPAELTDAPAALGDVANGNLGEKLLNARSTHERLALFSEFLHARIEKAQPEDSVVAASLRLIHRGIRSVRVPRLLKCLNVSERQFERRFLRAVGVPPHRYIRIVRFQEAVRLMKIRRFDRLSDIAYDLAYADQSHFIKDVREFSGYAPATLSRIVRTCVDFPCGLIPERTGAGEESTGGGAPPDDRREIDRGHGGRGERWRARQDSNLRPPA